MLASADALIVARIDQVLGGMLKVGANAAELTSDAQIALTFETGVKYGTQRVGHDALVAIVEEAAPPASLAALRSARETRFEHDAHGQTFAVEALVGALAIVATLQLRLTTNDGITGLGLLVPGLLVVAVALIAARALVPVAGLWGRFALRRGRLGVGLAAVELARRPGSQRLFVLLTVGAAMLAFVAAGADVASRARDDRVQRTLLPVTGRLVE